MKKIRSLIVLMLVFTVIISNSTFAAAYTGKNTPIVMVTENNGVRTAVSSDGVAEYTVVLNRNNNTISFTERNLRTGDSLTNCTAISNSISLSKLTLNRLIIEQDTDSGFKYIKTTGSTNEWHLERPKTADEGTGRYYFECWENTSNDSELEDFKNEVGTLADNEATLRSKTTVANVTSFIAGVLSGFSVASAGVLSPAAIAAIIATVGLTGAAMEAADVVANQCNDCMEAIEEVYYATDNMHF